jgi:hypothetical protein
MDKICSNLCIVVPHTRHTLYWFVLSLNDDEANTIGCAVVANSRDFLFSCLQGGLGFFVFFLHGTNAGEMRRNTTITIFLSRINTRAHTICRNLFRHVCVLSGGPLKPIRFLVTSCSNDVSGLILACSSVSCASGHT